MYEEKLTDQPTEPLFASSIFLLRQSYYAFTNWLHLFLILVVFFLFLLAIFLFVFFLCFSFFAHSILYFSDDDRNSVTIFLSFFFYGLQMEKRINEWNDFSNNKQWFYSWVGPETIFSTYQRYHSVSFILIMVFDLSIGCCC